jgi:SAM-dependent methyltransferase
MIWQVASEQLQDPPIVHKDWSLAEIKRLAEIDPDVRATARLFFKQAEGEVFDAQLDAIRHFSVLLMDAHRNSEPILETGDLFSSKLPTTRRLGGLASQPGELGSQIVPQQDLGAIYGRAFFAEQINGSVRSARVVVPLVMEMVRDVRSVVDVGCGAGTWLAQFKEAGVPRVLGLDGGAAAEQDQLEIEPEEFRAANLEGELDLDDSFDLCLCLEVAEHLTEHAAPVIVRNICKLSDIVLFSAAIPGQEGTHHINERWPSYWVGLFASAGYEVLDVVRGRVWSDERVEWWYRQNLLLFASKAGLSRIAQSAVTGRDSRTMRLDIVHPACFERYRRSSKQLEQRNADLEGAFQQIVNSTSWKLTWPLRWAITRVIGSDGIRRQKLRGMARVGWLVVSLKFLRRLRPKAPL